MYKNIDISNTSIFKVEFIDDDIQTKISVFPPKIKMLRKLSEIDENSTSAVEQITQCLADILSNNRENFQITAQWLEDILDIAELTQLLGDYFNWIDSINKSPN